MNTNKQSQNTAESHISIFNRVVDSHVGRVHEAMMAGVEAVVIAVRAECEARQPQPVAAGELSDTQHAILKEAFNEHGGERDAWHTWDTTHQGLFTKVFARVLSASRPAAPTYYETAKRPPTEKDANDRGMVLAIGSRYKDGWTDMDFRDVSDLTEGWTHWMPMPPAPVPPVSAEDAAWETHVAEDASAVSRKSWDAARAYFESKKDSGK